MNRTLRKHEPEETKSVQRRKEVQDACPVCGLPLGDHDRLDTCLRTAFSLPEEWEFTRDNVMQLGMNRKIITKWGQPGPGMVAFQFSSGMEVGMNATQFEIGLAKIYLRFFTPSPEVSND